MFSGIVAGTGRVLEVGSTPGAALRLIVDVRVLRRKLVPGASVAVSGVCLTVVRDPARRPSRAVFDVIGETVRKTTLGALVPGDPVNLEGSLRVGDEIGGHQVQGHVDGVGVVTGVERRADETWMTLRAPRAVYASLVSKGWVAVDGVSLTVADVLTSNRFAVALIPTTLGVTTLGRAVVGTRVNLEGDPLGKHVAHWLERHGLERQTQSRAGVRTRRTARPRS